MATSINREVRGPLSEREMIAEGAGLRRGVPVTTGSTTAYGVIADALGEDCQGIQISEGQLYDGSANYGQDSTHPAEQILVAKKGIVRALVPTSQTITKGMQAIPSAAGRVIARTAYSFSSFVLGLFDETITTTAAQYVSVEMRPQLIEIVRPVFSVATDATVGAATKYMAGVGVALSASAVPLGIVRFTGEKARNLWVSTGTAAGNTETLAVTVIKSSDNGGTWTDTTLTVTLTGTAGSLKYASELSLTSAALTAGDLVGVKLVSSAGTVGLVRVGFDLT